MSEARISYYEGMFLFPQAMSARLDEAIEHTNKLLGRVDAELVSMQKWGERPLAYPIDSHRRGIYLLTYFKCDRSKLVELERDCNLSETLLRALITRADHLTIEEMEAFDQREDLHVEAKLRAEQGENVTTPAGARPASAAVRKPEAKVSVETAAVSASATAVADEAPAVEEASKNDES